MKKFLLRALGFSCILITLFMIIACIFSWAAKSSHAFLDRYGEKEKMLSEVESPRIIFQGGSNVSLGINSEAVEDSIKMRTLNIALEVGLGMRLMLSEVSAHCRKGDILVLSPEYDHFYGGGYGRKSTTAILTLLHPTVIKYFNVRQIFGVAKGIPIAFDALGNTLVQKISDTMGDSNDHYSYTSLSFNAYGDEVAHWADSLTNYELEDYRISGTFDEKYFEEFCETISNLETRGIDVRIIPPAIYTKFYDESKEKMDYVAERLQKAGHPFEYDQVLSIYDREDMFDTPYHLAKSGIDKRMKLIIDMLQSHK